MIDINDQNDKPNETLASTAFLKLRNEIIAGAVDPDSKLLIRPLAERYGMGLSPIREALSRLAVEGWLRQTDQRGFTVTPLSLEDLRDLTATRCLLNESALAASIAQGDALWEESVVLARHRLLRTPRQTNEAAGIRSPQWENAHKAFHASLISACGSQRICAQDAQLFDAFERYRIIARVAVAHGRSDTDEHDAIADAVLKRDAKQAVTLLNSHIRLTEMLVREALWHAGPPAEVSGLRA